MDFNKNDSVLIRASAYGLDSAATDNFEAAVMARLEGLIEGGTVSGITKNHFRGRLHSRVGDTSIHAQATSAWSQPGAYQGSAERLERRLLTSAWTDR